MAYHLRSLLFIICTGKRMMCLHLVRTSVYPDSTSCMPEKWSQSRKRPQEGFHPAPSGRCREYYTKAIIGPGTSRHMEPQYSSHNGHRCHCVDMTDTHVDTRTLTPRSEPHATTDAVGRCNTPFRRHSSHLETFSFKIKSVLP